MCIKLCQLYDRDNMKIDPLVFFVAVARVLCDACDVVSSGYMGAPDASKANNHGVVVLFVPWKNFACIDTLVVKLPPLSGV